MYKKIIPWLVFFFIFLVSACSSTDTTEKKSKIDQVEITISAAASLKDALMEIKTEFQKENKQVIPLFNLGGSGALQQQIIQGAPVDVFISASKDQFDALTRKDLIDSKEQVDLLSNQLVLITNKNNKVPIKKFEDLDNNEIHKVAIGTPESVPAGMYAKQALIKYQVWEALQPKLIQTKDVRQVLTYVETRSVDAGIVYMTDVSISKKVKVIAISEEGFHEPIIYSAGVIHASKKKDAAIHFYEYLQSNTAKQIFKKYGFTVLD
ncbi:molybdate ABC transporter substrate-binding protein [Neobacillus drentensis]|uniref:molybdate ABC transporter substrate-binding protein n=1 Tax=Neobacillus drentensis TaxID=220684 RepID=UPI002FFEAE32